MAHFYGKLNGNRGETTRCGSRNSGIRSTLASWDGAVTTEICNVDGKDVVKVYLHRWQGKGVEKIIYTGNIDGDAQ